MYLVPFVVAVCSWLILGETITFMQIAGGLIIIAGLYLAQHRMGTNAQNVAEAKNA